MMNASDFYLALLDKSLTTDKTPPTLVGDAGRTKKVVVVVKRRRNNSRVTSCHYTFRDEDPTLVWFDAFGKRTTPEQLLELCGSL